MENRKNGFTLVEMIVCIAIIAFLGIAIGLNSDKLFKGANVSSYEDQFRELMEAASIYAELSDTGLNCSTSCNISLAALVNKGLVDKNIYEQDNPIYKNSIKFNSTDVFTVQISSGIKDVVFKCKPSNSTYDIKLSVIEDYDYWGEC